MGLPHPLEVLDIFGRKSKFWAPMTLIFGTKRPFIEFNNWWNFGVDISKHFWVILIWPFCSSNSFPTTYKDDFVKKISCKSAEIFIRISQTVLDLAKISVSIPSISWDVLELFHTSVIQQKDKTKLFEQLDWKKNLWCTLIRGLTSHQQMQTNFRPTSFLS